MFFFGGGGCTRNSAAKAVAEFLGAAQHSVATLLSRLFLTRVHCG